MQVGRLQLAATSALITALIVCAGSAAQAVERQTAAYTFHYFSDVDGVSVASNFISYNVAVAAGLQMAFQWNHENVTVPAVEAPPGSQDAVDAITSASRPIQNVNDAFQDFIKVRNELQGALTYRKASMGYYVSNEADYHAQMAWANYNVDLLNSNLNLALGFSYAWDFIKPLQDEDTESAADTRQTTHWNLVATQILTPTTVFRIGGQVSFVSGLQHNPYRTVYASGSYIPELHPGQRDRKDFFIRLSQYINNRSSIRIDYKYYTDDWGIDSQTIGVKLNQYVTPDFVVRYRYRYYTQVGAYFFRDEYLASSGVDGYLTADYRLNEFDAHLFGGRILWNPYNLVKNFGWLENVQLILSYERYFNDNNFSASVYETGLQLTF